MNWAILGIEPTTDKSAITKAYRAKLSVTNPEDDPEGFKALRAAYEEALAAADAPEKEEPEDMSPLGQWLSRVKATYDDYPRRVQVEAWKELLADDMVQALDTRADAEAALLSFLMHDYYVPRDVWQLLNDAFDWPQRADELKEALHPDFVTYVVLNGAVNDPVLPFQQFQPGLDGKAVDEYIHAYIRARHAETPEGEEAQLAIMEGLSESHPHGTAQRIMYQVKLARLAVSEEQEGAQEALPGIYAAALEQMAALRQAFPEDSHLMIEGATLCMWAGEFAQAEALAQAAIDREPEQIVAFRIKADAQEEQGLLAEAVETLNSAMDLTQGNQRTLYELETQRRNINERLIQRYTEELEANPEDVDARFNLAWCYVQNQMDAEGEEVARSLPLEAPDPFAYYNLKACIANGLERRDEEQHLLESLIKVIEGLEPDGTPKTARRIRRLPEMMLRLANTYRTQGNTQQALEVAERACTMAPENAEILTFATQLLYGMKDLDRAALYVDQLTRVANRSYHGFLLKAIINYDLHRDGIAYTAINDAIDLDPTDLVEYHIKMLLLLRNDLYDDLQQVIDFLKENELGGDLTLRYCEAFMVGTQEGHDAEGLEALKALEPEVDELPLEDKPRWAADYFFRMTSLTASVQDAAQNYDRAPLLALLDKALEADPENLRCMDYKAWLLKKEGRKEEAIQLYTKLVTAPHRGSDPEQELGRLYYDDLDHCAPDALKCYETIIEDEPENGDWEFYAGMCNTRMGRWEEAERHFLAEQEKAPDDVDGYYRLAFVYLCMNRLEEALVQGLRAIELTANRKPDSSNHLFTPAITALNRLGRVDEAVALCRQAMECNPKSANRRMNDIADCYARAGRIKDVDATLKEWGKLKDVDGGRWAFVNQRNLIAQGKFTEARISFKMGDEGHMGNADAAWIGNILDLEGGHGKAAVKRSRTFVEIRRQEADSDLALALDHLMMALWATGQEDEARTVAAELLDLVDEELSLFCATNRTLHMTRRIAPLAVLGRVEEAEEALELSKRLPLCEMCAYAVCRDALVFESRLAVVLDDWDRAQTTIENGLAQWPGEEDFHYNAGLLAVAKKQRGVR